VEKMGRIDDNLSGDEKIVYRTGLHWVTFCGPAMLLFLAGVSIQSKGKPAIVLFIIGLVWAILSYITLRTTEFAITNKRVLVWTIFPWKKLHDLALDGIADAAVYQPSLGKFLDFGKITIVLVNGKRVSRRLVSAPYELLKNLSEQVEATRGRRQEPPQK
jgi:hypothetical protein